MLEVPIYSGLTHLRILGGIDLRAAMLLGVGSFLAAFIAFMYGGALIGFLSLLALCLTIIPLWSFLAYQTKKDPQWFRIWINHLQLRKYYRV